MGDKSLTIHMQRALGAVRRDPGKRGHEYPGGWRSVDALRRRKLVRVEGQTVTPSDAGTEVHLHAFNRTLHLDACHYFSDAGTCECGATYTSYVERDLKEDPYSAIWMETSADDERCERCIDLQNGAKPIVREQVSEPKQAAA